jgi:acyl carrier protein
MTEYDYSSVLAIMQEQAGDLLEVNPKDVVPAVSLVNDLKVDSLSLVEFLMDLEDRFEVGLEEGELDHISTVGELIDLILLKRR